MSGRKVIVALGFANGVPCPHAGQYLESFDFDAHDGIGEGAFTRDPRRAMLFDDAHAAFAFWRTVSTVRPIRGDGRPNRPLTALSVQVDDEPTP